ncbi:MAG: class I SAM-dependent methyltransferase [Chromatiales bacterium]|jgi:SAM-dependent methyltransferase
MSSNTREKEESLFQQTKPKKFRQSIRRSVDVAVEKFLETSPEFEEVVCPFCQHEAALKYFSISGMEYLRCDNCHSLYNSPRPKIESLDRFYALHPAQLPITDVVCSVLEDVPESYGDCDLLFLNSVIEHPHSLGRFFQKARQLLKIGGVISLVDMHSGGLDIELLRGEAQNVNLFFILQIGSIEGINSLATRNGFEVLDVFSVGQMGADIVYDYATGVDVDHPPYGLSNQLANDELRTELQQLLQKHHATGYNGYLLRRLG